MSRDIPFRLKVCAVSQVAAVLDLQDVPGYSLQTQSTCGVPSLSCPGLAGCPGIFPTDSKYVRCPKSQLSWTCRMSRDIPYRLKVRAVSQVSAVLDLQDVPGYSLQTQSTCGVPSLSCPGLAGCPRIFSIDSKYVRCPKSQLSWTHSLRMSQDIPYRLKVCTVSQVSAVLDLQDNPGYSLVLQYVQVPSPRCPGRLGCPWIFHTCRFTV